MADHVDAVFASEPVPGDPGTSVGPQPADLFADHVDTPRPPARMFGLQRWRPVQKIPKRLDPVREQHAPWAAFAVKDQFVQLARTPVAPKVRRKMKSICPTAEGQDQGYVVVQLLEVP